MVPLFESIRCFNGRIYNIKAHNERVYRSRKAVLGIDERVDLRSLIQVPGSCKKGLFKCRIAYGMNFDNPVFTKYTPRKIRSLKIVDVHFDYNHKSEDRSNINEAFAQRGDCDDVLMVRDGLITDTSYANVAFFDGDNWYTPSSPMLEGTRRTQLLKQNRIIESPILRSDLYKFKRVALFNAMISFGQCLIPIQEIN